MTDSERSELIRRLVTITIDGIMSLAIVCGTDVDTVLNMIKESRELSKHTSATN